MFKTKTIEDTLFDLKFTNKQLERLARKSEKEQMKQQAKVKKYIEKKDVETARIYAENAIRKKNEGLNYLRMAARVDAVAARVESAMSMKDVAKTIGNVTKGLEKAMASMDLEKVAQVMDNFETQFEGLDVQSQTMDASMSAAMTLSTPADQVDDLIRQVAAENDLDVEAKLQELQPGAASLRSTTEAASEDREDQLSRRLAALRN